MMERAAEADARADVYGLGMTLAFLFYEKDLTMEVIRNTDRMIGELHTSEAVRMVIRTAITWNREHRFRSAAEFHSALQAAVTRRESVPPTVKAAATQIARPTATVIPEVNLDSSPGPTVEPPARPAVSLEAPAIPAAPTAPTPAGTIEAAFAALHAESTTAPPPPPPPAPRPRRSSGAAVAAGPHPSESAPSLARRFAAIAIDAEIQGERAAAAVFDSLEVHEDAQPMDAPPSSITARRDDQTLADTPRRLSARQVAPLALGVAVVLALLYFLAL